MSSVSVTTVTPVYAGKAYLPDLIARIKQVKEEWRKAGAPLRLTEAIFVNDASEDGSLDVLNDIQAAEPWIKIVNLSRNFGQHQATIAGILHSSGDWILTLDEDLQHDPVFVEKMLQSAIQSGQDVVYAAPEQGVHGNLLRDWSSVFFKRLISCATGNQHIRKFNSFRLIRGGIARAASSVCSHGTYFDMALCWFTNRILSIKLPLKDQRFAENGTSGYTLRKLLRHARLMVVSSETKLVRIGSGIGFLAMLTALVSGTATLLEHHVDPSSIPVRGWLSLFLAILFFNGLLAVLSGIVLEYISVILLHIQGKPTFFVIDRSSDEIIRKYYDKAGS